MKTRTMEKGFSLIEVVIAMSVLVVMSLGLASVISNQAQQISYLEDKLSYQGLQKEIDSLLDDSDFCKKTFSGLNLSNLVANEKDIKIKNNSGEVLFDSSNKKKNSYKQLTLNKVFIKGSDISAKDLGGKVTLNVNVERKRRGGGPTELSPIEKEVYLNLKSLTDRSIDSCSSGTKASFLDGQWVNVEYSTESHESVCKRVGLAPYHSFALGKCASGEVRPRFGNDADKINYRYGTWGGSNISGGDVTTGGYCYGGKRDWDGTDRTVAYFCK